MFTIPQTNLSPTAIGAVNFFTMVSTGYIADKIGTRAPVCLGRWAAPSHELQHPHSLDVPHGAKMFAFIFNGIYGCFTPLLAVCCNETYGGDQQKRAFILGLMTSVGPAVVISFQQLQFPNSQAPAFTRTHGWGSALAFVIALTLWTSVGTPALQKHFSKRVQTDEFASEHEVEVSS